MNDANDVVVLTSAANEFEATAIVSRLDAEGIKATTAGELTSGFRAGAPGFVKILVQRSDFDRAVLVLKEVQDS